MNQVAIVFGLLIAAIIGAGAFQALSPLLAEAENKNMEAEILNIISAAVEYNWANRVTGTVGDFEDLVDQGYLDGQIYDDGDEENVIGNDIAAGLNPGSATASTITYTADDAGSCEWLEQRANSGVWPKVSDTTASVCAASVLTVTLE